MSAAVIEVASALVAKLRQVHDDPRYMGVWMLAQQHAGPYVGPKYDTELAELEAALARIAPNELHDKAAELRGRGE